MNREERKAIFIAKATTHFDTPEIRKEAEEMFEKANPAVEELIEELNEE